MLQNIKELYGNKLAALDGDIGRVKDFYFDDKTWVIRYLVADTGSWLAGRLVLLSPHAFGKLDQFERTLHIKLRKQRMEDSPAIEAHKPVSRQDETDHYRYYGWPAYWEGDAMWGLGGYPMVIPPTKDERGAKLRHHPRDDQHLQSAQAVDGYEIKATDGVIGTVNGFMVDDKSWAIRELVAETGHWYSGKQLMIAPGKIDRISHEDSTVFVNLTKAQIQPLMDADLTPAGAKNQ
jgi:hypothetical protein